MVIAVDIGNTRFHMGWFENEKLIRSEAFTSSLQALDHRLRAAKDHSRAGVDGCVLVSVVPLITPQVIGRIKKILQLNPVVVSARLKCGIAFGYRDPARIGADRIALVVGGRARHKRNLIIVDFGTATTIDVVFRNGRYPGGLIMPGIETGLWALTRRTSLKRAVINEPAVLIGRSTEEGINSGLINGHASMVQGLIRRIKAHYRRPFLCIATGGWGRVMSARVPDFDEYDPALCLYGAVKIYQYNRK